MSVNLLTLLDDIASLLDDVAALSKVATKKTAGVLGDDLALNAEQLTGFHASRELPIIWSVTKGSFLNKLFLVPIALLISAIYPPLIQYLLMLGGCFLCFEGVEKLMHSFLHKKKKQSPTPNAPAILPAKSSEALEKAKIKGAIRTDFILSAEIIVITLGSMQSASMLVQILTLSLLAVLFTIAIYGLVAAIIKLDDLGLYWLQSSQLFLQKIGKLILIIAPWIMKLLSIVGTIAMFLVGGGIIVHGIHFLEQFAHQITTYSSSCQWQGSCDFILNSVFTLIVGVIIGVLLVASLHILKPMISKFQKK